MRLVTVIALLILIIGGINWGLVGVWQFNFVDYLFARVFLDRIIYVIVGICALWVLFASPILFSCKK
ncbi:MAG: DUF378 domain-containing protein [Verrucomicrobia bacterium]|nr:DUF378 domain-containing protein [Verrucomicrobiota bacterium]